MLWHFAAICNVSKFSSLFCIFLRNYWSDLDQTLIFVHAVDTLQSIVKFQNFLQFFAFFSGTTAFILIKLWFLFMLWYILQPLAMFPNFLHFLAFFLRNYWSDLDQIFDFCSCCGTLQPIATFPNFLHFFPLFLGTTGLILIKLWF